MISLFSFGGVTFSFVTLEIKISRPRKGEEANKVSPIAQDDIHPRPIPDVAHMPELLTAATKAEPGHGQSQPECLDTYFVEEPDGTTFEIEPEPWMIEKFRVDRVELKIPPEGRVAHIIKDKYFLERKDGTQVEIDPEPWMIPKYRRKTSA
jgi:hypothetical protein